MGYLNEQQVVMAKFDTWTACPVKREGVPFKEPTGSPYIAPFILGGEAQEATIGSPALRRHVNVLMVQILERENQGIVTMLTLADTLESMFINANSQIMISALEYIHFASPYLVPTQPTGGWMQKNFVCPFYRDQYL